MVGDKVFPPHFSNWKLAMIRIKDYLLHVIIVGYKISQINPKNMLINYKIQQLHVNIW